MNPDPNKQTSRLSVIRRAGTSRAVGHEQAKQNYRSSRERHIQQTDGDGRAAVFTSVDEHESLPQTHAQQVVLHHQTGEASRQVPLRSRHVIDNPAVPGGQQRMGASLPLPANAPRLGSLPASTRDNIQH